MINWITPVEITPGTVNAWTDADVSANVPAGATGVILHIAVPSSAGGTGRDIGFRKNGSSDNRYNFLYERSHFWAAIGVDANRILELYVGSTTALDVYLVGYFTTGASFFTNAVDKSLGTVDSWLDIDISANTGGDTAIGAIFEIIQTEALQNWGLRKNGSGDSRIRNSYKHVGAIIGVDDSEICEGRVANLNADFYLVGYVKNSVIFNTNAIDLSLGTTQSWTDLPTLPLGASGGLIEITSGMYLVGLRKDGSSEDICKAPGGYSHCWGMVEASAARKIEAYKHFAGARFYLIGYPVTFVSYNVEKTTAYKIKQVLDIARSAGYKIKYSTDVSKQAIYKIISGKDIERQAEYRIPAFDQDIEKQATYEISTPKDIERQARYDVSTAIEKLSEYRVLQIIDIEKQAQYEVIEYTQELKTALYAILEAKIKEIEAEYKVLSIISIEKQAAYGILIEAVKNAEYRISRGLSQNKETRYRITKTDQDKTKQATYVIISERIDILKQAQYFIPVTYENKYQKQNSVYDNKYQKQNSPYNNKYQKQNTSYNNKY